VLKQKTIATFSRKKTLKNFFINRVKQSWFVKPGQSAHISISN